MSVESWIRYVYPHAINLKPLHSGYVANTYIFTSEDKKYICKEIVIKHDVRISSNLTARDIFNRELESLNRLSSRLFDSVIIPLVLAKSEKNCMYVIPFYDFTPFNQVLLNDEKVEDCIRSLGKFLAQFHSNNAIDANTVYLHGDLNNKNIGLLNDGKVLILDPSYRDDEIKGSLYKDVGRMLLNFFPYSPRHFWKVPKQKRFVYAQRFLETYAKESKLPFDKQVAIQKSQEILRNKKLQPAVQSKKLKHYIMDAMVYFIAKQLKEFSQIVG